MGAERLRLAVDWRGESGRKGNALTGGARRSATERGEGTSVAPELGWWGLLGRAAEAVANPPEWADALLGWRCAQGRGKGELGQRGEKAYRPKMKKGGEKINFLFLFPNRFSKSTFK